MNRYLEWMATIIACIGLAIVASGCAHSNRSPPCVSGCGMLLEGGNGAMSCDVLDKAEKTMLEQVDKEFCSTDPRMCKKAMCNSLFGWQIQADKETIHVIEYDGGIRVSAVGASQCANKVMWLGDDLDWRHGSYPHEFFHVIQNCDAQWPWEDPEEHIHGPGHRGWQERGIYSLIEDIENSRR